MKCTLYHLLGSIIISTITFIINQTFADYQTILPKNANLVDLTHLINNNSLSWIYIQEIILGLSENGTLNSTSLTEYMRKVASVQISTHIATHLHAPCSVSDGGWCVSDIPIEHLLERPAVLIDTSDKYISNSSYEITVSDIEKHESFHNRIEDGSIILFKTGWSRFWPNYTNSIVEFNDEIRYPGLSYEACKWLSENRGIIGIGIESPGLVSPKNKILNGHKLIFDKNIWVIVNLPNLEKIPPKGSILTVLPLRLEQASSSPCRVIANLNASDYNLPSQFSSLMPYRV